MPCPRSGCATTLCLYLVAPSMDMCQCRLAACDDDGIRSALPCIFPMLPAQQQLGRIGGRFSSELHVRPRQPGRPAAQAHNGHAGFCINTSEHQMSINEYSLD